MRRVGFEPTIPLLTWPKTDHALDRAAVIGPSDNYHKNALVIRLLYDSIPENFITLTVSKELRNWHV
jgi:hypothetical protein